jgi:hypothetical protein
MFSVIGPRSEGTLDAEPGVAAQTHEATALAVSSAQLNLSCKHSSIPAYPSTFPVP